MRVLVVEDERKLAQVLASALQAEHYDVVVAPTGEDGFFRANAEVFDLVVLDLMLPGRNGLEILQTLRQRHIDTPVLILTARGLWTERVEGINAGADDYLAKPFEMEELLARLRAIVRRSSGQAAPVLKSGPLLLDTRQMRISLRGVPVALSPLEYRLLAFLMHHAGRVVAPTELAEHLYSSGNERDPNTIEVIVARLRRKLGNDIIETRRGFGYLVPDGPD